MRILPIIVLVLCWGISADKVYLRSGEVKEGQIRNVQDSAIYLRKDFTALSSEKINLSVVDSLTLPCCGLINPEYYHKVSHGFIDKKYVTDKNHQTFDKKVEYEPSGLSRAQSLLTGIGYFSATVGVALGLVVVSSKMSDDFLPPPQVLVLIPMTLISSPLVGIYGYIKSRKREKVE